MVGKKIVGSEEKRRKKMEKEVNRKKIAMMFASIPRMVKKFLTSERTQINKK